MFVKPNHKIVRDPVTGRPLPEDGAEVPESFFWLTRLRHGDVSAAEPPETAAGEKT